MKLHLAPFRGRQRQAAWALLAVMSLGAAGLLVLAGVMDWADENSTRTERNNEYFVTSYAAEAATEKVMSKISQDFQNYGLETVTANLSTYQSLLPSANDSSPAGYWTNFQFSGGHTSNQIIVTNTSTSNSTVLGAPYTGLTMQGNTYEIIANAQNVNSEYKIVSTVGQQVQFGSIPLFQFAIFYQNDMELAPNTPMTVTGTVHGNANIYVEPSTSLVFSNAVSAVGQVIAGESPLDPTARYVSNAVFDGFDLSGVDPLNLPVGTNTTGNITNVSDNVYGILQLPTPTETPNDPSGVGQKMLYNQADLIIVISNNNTISVTSGASINGQATVISNSQWQAFMNTNGSFYDQRDNLTVNPVTIDVSNLVNWSATNNVLRPVLANARSSAQADIESIYVADMRSTTNMVVTYSTNGIHHTVTATTNYTVTTQPGIVLSNGSVLPPQGLSVATPDPAYVVGNWNVKNSFSSTAPSDAGLADTTYTAPSAIYADAVTVLSSAWNPANSTQPLTNRPAVSDTVNAALLTGNVPSNGAEYSGGVENFMRFLENWNNQTLTYNGSLVQMFQSHIAKAPYPGTGSVYNPPTRNWAFDNNFTNPNKQPPLMPRVLAVERSGWALLPPYTTSF